MEQQSRREFIARALIAGAGATLFRDFAPGDFGPSSAEAASIGEIDPNFVAGRITNVYLDGLITVLDTDSQLRNLKITPSSRIWKQGLWNTEILTPSDCIYARGEIGATGLMEIDRVWVDIQCFSATVLTATVATLTIEMPSGGQYLMSILPTAPIENISGGFSTGDASALEAGWPIQVVGFGNLFSNSFTVSRVDLLTAQAGTTGSGGDLYDPIAPPENPQVPQCPYVYKGITTWFCCGGVTGCGAGGRCPNNTSGGSCGGCRSDYLHMAWPKLTNGCGPYCGSSCSDCVPNMPKLSCGKSVQIFNPCNSNSVSVSVKDCGPQVHCISPKGCNNYTKVKFDLTPCAFSRIGNLDSGTTTCHATVYFPCQ